MSFGRQRAAKGHGGRLGAPLPPSADQSLTLRPVTEAGSRYPGGRTKRKRRPYGNTRVPERQGRGSGGGQGKEDRGECEHDPPTPGKASLGVGTVGSGRVIHSQNPLQRCVIPSRGVLSPVLQKWGVSMCISCRMCLG